MTVASDYTTGIICIATDSADQSVTCPIVLTAAPASPSIPLVRSPGICYAPVIPEPSNPPGTDPFHSECITYGATDNNNDGVPEYYKQDGPSDKTCGQCQWQCLTNNRCAGISMFGIDDIILTENLYEYNCGDGSWNNGLELCVLMGADGSSTVGTWIDTQQQGCTECQHQCQTWSSCTGVYYGYTYYPKADLELMCC